MSGGAFDYQQYRIEDIAVKIEHAIPNECHSEQVKAMMQDAVVTLRKAASMAHRIDWYLSGDDSEETLVQRWEEERLP